MTIKRLFKYIGSIIQILIIIFSIVIHYLSRSKMGVMRSITYRNSVLDSLEIKNVLVVVLILILIAYIISLVIGKKYRMKKNIFITLAYLVITLFLMYLDSTLVLVYYVLLIGSIVILLIEFVKLNFLHS